jgi:hypothetical protein
MRLYLSGGALRRFRRSALPEYADDIGVGLGVSKHGRSPAEQRAMLRA